MCDENKLTPQTISELTQKIAEANKSKKQKLADLSVALETLFRRTRRDLAAVEERVSCELSRPLTASLASNFVHSCALPFRVMISAADRKYNIEFQESTKPVTASEEKLSAGTVDEFAEFFAEQPIGELLTTQTDSFGMGRVYAQYMSKLYDAVSEFCMGKLISERMMSSMAVSMVQEDVFHFVQSHIMRQLSEVLVPTVASQKDTVLRSKMKAYRWIDPERLNVKGDDMRYGSLDVAVQGITAEPMSST